jgi:hypothetical protein
VLRADPHDPAAEPAAIADRPFRMLVDGRSITGRTTPDGIVEASVPVTATEVTLVVDPDGPHPFAMTLLLGDLDPVETPRGRAQREANLGAIAASLDDAALRARHRA